MKRRRDYSSHAFRRTLESERASRIKEDWATYRSWCRIDKEVE